MLEIYPMELLAALQKVEQRGAIETADRVLMLARQVWDYWLPTADVQLRNSTEGLKGRLTPYRGKSFAAIVEPLRMGELLRAIKRYKGGGLYASPCSWPRCRTSARVTSPARNGQSWTWRRRSGLHPA